MSTSPLARTSPEPPADFKISPTLLPVDSAVRSIATRPVATGPLAFAHNIDSGLASFTAILVRKMPAPSPVDMASRPVSFPPMKVPAISSSARLPSSCVILVDKPVTVPKGPVSKLSAFSDSEALSCGKAGMARGLALSVPVSGSITGP
ncbi:hypothetical protein D3C87_1554370 [compost metagenome]